MLKLQRTIVLERNSPQLHRTFSCSIPPLGQVSDKQKTTEKPLTKLGEGGV